MARQLTCYKAQVRLVPSPDTTARYTTILSMLLEADKRMESCAIEKKGVSNEQTTSDLQRGDSGDPN